MAEHFLGPAEQSDPAHWDRRLRKMRELGFLIFEGGLFQLWHLCHHSPAPDCHAKFQAKGGCGPDQFQDSRRFFSMQLITWKRDHLYQHYQVQADIAGGISSIAGGISSICLNLRHEVTRPLPGYLVEALRHSLRGWTVLPMYLSCQMIGSLPKRYRHTHTRLKHWERSLNISSLLTITVVQCTQKFYLHMILFYSEQNLFFQSDKRHPINAVTR